MRLGWFGVAALVGAVSAGAWVSVGCGSSEATGPNGQPTSGKPVGDFRSTALSHEACTESGRVEKFDATNDGKVDIVKVYDANGHEKCRFSDLDHDGKPDLFQFFDAQGQLRRREAFYTGSALPTVIEYFEAGKLSKRELDATNQGRIDTWETYDVTTGKIVKRERDSTGDGRIDQWWTFEGDKVTIAMDRNGDGLPDPESTVTLGANGQPIATPTDAGAATPPPAPSASASAAPTSTPTSPTPTPSADADAGPKRGGAKR